MPHIVLQQVNVGLNDGLVDWGLFLLALLLIGILDLWFYLSLNSNHKLSSIYLVFLHAHLIVSCEIISS